MRVLVACEFSGVVRQAFRARGHDAWSCDLQPAMDESEFHIQGDVINQLDKEWEMMIAHPPCTYISNMSNCRIHEAGRRQLREDGFAFFMIIAGARIPKVAIENPRGLPERRWRPADQIIHPFQFGHAASKATCLWLKALPVLRPTNNVIPERKWDGKRWRTWVDKFGSKNAHLRSITFQGIADAMAEQWGSLPATISQPEYQPQELFP